VLALLAAAVALTVSGCTDEASGADRTSAQAGATSVSAVPADDVTGQIAAVEAARQCTVSATSFADESAITVDLDARLAAAGLTHQQWKDWHDALAASPDLVTQLTSVSSTAC
jgi:hypothetical protein